MDAFGCALVAGTACGAFSVVELVVFCCFLLLCVVFWGFLFWVLFLWFSVRENGY